MYKTPEMFKLYITKSDGLRIPNKNNVIFLHSEDNIDVPLYIKALNIPSFYVRYYAYSRKYKVLSRMVSLDIKKMAEELKGSKVIPYRIEQLRKSDKSFYYDLSPFTESVLKRFSGITRYNKTLLFLNNIIKDVSANKKSYLILIKDKTLSSGSPDYSLIYTLLYAVRKQITFPVDKVFLFNGSTDKGEYYLIYDSSKGKQNTYSRLKKIVSKYFNIKEDQVDAETVSSEEAVTDQKSKVQSVIKHAVNMAKQSGIKDPEKLNALKMSMDYLNNIDPDMFKVVDLKNNEEVKDLVQIALASLVNPTEMNLIKFKSQSAVNMDAVLNDLLKSIQSIKDRPIVAEVQTEDPINDEKIINDIVGKINLDISLSRRTIEKKLVEQWLFEVASVLSEKDIPLDVQSVSIDDVNPENDETEIAPSHFETWKIRYKSPSGKSFTVSFIVPKLVEDRYTVLGNVKGFFPFVMATLPIFVKSPGEVILYTLYSTFRVYYKEKKKLPAIWTMIGGIKIPLIYVVGLLKPIPELLKDYGVEYTITNSPENCRLSYNIGINKYICVTGSIDKEVEYLLNGLKHLPPKHIEEDIVGDRFYIEVIKQNFGPKAEFQINSILNNVIDPITKKVLSSYLLPDNIYDVLKYMNHLAAYQLDIDKFNLNNIRIRQQDVILESIYKTLHKAYSKYRYQRLSNVKEASFSVPSNAVIAYLRNTNALDILEEASPIEELESLSKVKLVGPGALPNRKALTIKDRSLRPSYFGTFDPIDTSEGDPGAYQILTTGALNLSLLGRMREIPKNDDYTKILSPAASLIPFVEKDDGNRALMACNQMKQALPIISSEPPMVQTGYESIFPSLVSNTHAVKAKNDGKVLHIGNDYMIVQYKDGKKEQIDLKPQSLFGMVSLKSASIKKPIKNVGDSFKKNEIIASNTFIDHDTLQLSQGKNVNVAFMLYDGYNFEDGVVVTESLAKSLTSLHSNTYRISLVGTKELTSLLPIGTKIKKGQLIASTVTRLSGEAIDYIAEFDGQVTNIRIYANSPIKKYPVLMERINEMDEIIKEKNKVLKKYGMEPEETVTQKIRKNYGKYKFKGELIEGVQIYVDVIYYKPIQLGDKVHNRHGNKGVICHIIPDNEAPRLPNGEPIELMFTTLGVVGRMNMGQVFELYTGRIIHELENKIKVNPHKKDYLKKLIADVYTVLDSSENKTYSKYLIKNLDIDKVIKRVLSGKHLSIVIKQFNKITFDNITKAYKLLGINIAEKLYLPKYKKETKNPVSVGVQYIEKLEHMTGIKETARSLGKYNPVTEQAVSGRKMGGGQRVGEMDTWAYLAYQAENVLSDFFNSSGDKTITKQIILNQIIQNGEAHLPEEEIDNAGSKRAIEAYLAGMGVITIPDTFKTEIVQ